MHIPWAHSFLLGNISPSVLFQATGWFLLELLLFPSLLPDSPPPFLILLLTLLTVSFRVARNSLGSHTMQTILLGHTSFPSHQCCLPYPIDSSSRSGKASFSSKPSLEFDLEFFSLNYSILSWSSVSMKEVIDQGSCKASFRVLDYLSGWKVPAIGKTFHHLDMDCPRQ